MSIKTINKKYQSAVNKTYKHYRAYQMLADLDGTFETDKEQNANDRKQATQYDNFFNIYEDLPQREKLNFDRQHKKIHGY